MLSALARVSDVDAGESNATDTLQFRISADEAETSSVRPDKPAITLEQPTTYYRAVFFTTVALKRRFGKLKDRTAFREVHSYQQMAKEYEDAINETREIKQGS